jgi:hypothetical protein
MKRWVSTSTMGSVMRAMRAAAFFCRSLCLVTGSFRRSSRWRTHFLSVASSSITVPKLTSLAPLSIETSF